MKKSFLLIGVAIVCLLFFNSCRNNKTSIANVNSRSLKTTSVSAHLEAEIEQSHNILYCASFQLAYNTLKDDIIKADIRFPYALAIAERLNNATISADDISHTEYIAMVGTKNDDIENEINTALKSKFKASTPALTVPLNSTDDLVIYAHLFKNIKFNTRFEDLKDELIFRRGLYSSRVDSFGIQSFSSKHKEMGEQVEIIDFISSEDFIVRFKTDNIEEELVLARVEPMGTLMETINLVQNRIDTKIVQSLREGDSLMIPKFYINISHSYDELIGKRITNAGFNKFNFAHALQDTVFSMNPKVVKASSGSRSRSSDSSVEGRELLFNRPFLLYIKEKNAKEPYFALWVDNPEILISR
jgi:hypothetical protein